MTRPLNEQVVVITGASSGIGRAAALEFAKQGASLVLAARNLNALNEVAADVLALGGRAIAVSTDVGDWDEVRHLAAAAVTTYGRIDTWVNDAGVSVYATAEEMNIDEVEQIMRTNFLGVVHGVQAALPYMRQQGEGTLINIGSVESQRALPYHAVYSASKHAVKGYTEALRMELMHEHPGIQVTLILPSGINTPFFSHARSRMGAQAQPFPPAYPPELVASAIVNAAQHPQRDIYVGGAGWLFWLLERISPALVDQLLVKGGLGFKLQRSNQPEPTSDNLYSPAEEDGTGRVEGDFAHLTKPSMYTPVAELAPVWLRRALLVLPTLVVPLIVLVSRNREQQQRSRRWPLFG
ncbi:MAG: SDR family oxidoreductase [Anaerolineae bacterium]